MGRTVLLTGASGFIGAHVARRLLDEGCEVAALVRPGGVPWRIADIVASLRVVRGDLMAPDDLKRTIAALRPEVCVHLAWCAEPGAYLHSPDNVRFLTASLEMATALADAGCRRFVGIGTCLEYDASAGTLSESSALGPASLYAASKAGLGLMLEQVGRLMGMRVAWVRLFHLYGPYEDQRRLVPSVINALTRGEQAQVTEGRQVRDFLHVEDVASAIWAVAASDLTGAVNVGSGHGIAVRDLVARIGALMGRSDRIAFGARPQPSSESMAICADIHRLLANAAWRPRYDLDQGLRQTIAWWQARLVPR
jgi:nucleoside-diphosphate-sugar epimerase